MSSPAQVEGLVAQSDIHLLLVFEAPGCPPCQSYSTEIDDLIRQRPGRVRVATIDVSKGSELAEEYSILSVPAAVLVICGKPTKMIHGARSSSYLLRCIDEVGGASTA